MSRKQELLNYIAEYERERKKLKELRRQESIAEISKELKFIRERKAAAKERMEKQAAAGDKENARRSSKAFKYCEKYEKQLANILEGYKAHPGKHFTKDARNRFVNSIEPPKK